MEIKINIQKRYFFGIVGILLLLGVVFGVYAAIDSSSPNPGHNINELGGITCANGEAITRNASGWQCISVSESSSSSGNVFIGTDYKMFVGKDLTAGVIIPGKNYSSSVILDKSCIITAADGWIKYDSSGNYMTKVTIMNYNNVVCDSGWVDGLASCSGFQGSCVYNNSLFFVAPFGEHQLPVLRGRQDYSSNHQCAQASFDYPNDDFGMGVWTSSCPSNW